MSLDEDPEELGKKAADPLVCGSRGRYLDNLSVDPLSPRGAVMPCQECLPRDLRWYVARGSAVSARVDRHRCAPATGRFAISLPRKRMPGALTSDPASAARSP